MPIWLVLWSNLPSRTRRRASQINPFPWQTMIAILALQITVQALKIKIEACKLQIWIIIVLILLRNSLDWVLRRSNKKISQAAALTLQVWLLKLTRMVAISTTSKIEPQVMATIKPRRAICCSFRATLVHLFPENNQINRTCNMETSLKLL